MSKVSVAMTTYQGTQFILKQLQSILHQTRQPDEVIICDDCSQDHTVSMVQQFIEEHHLVHWHFYENQHNLGYAKNFRKALSLTSGEIVFLCDQDDIWEKEKIACMAGIMEGQPAISALACSYRLIDGDDRPAIGAAKKFYEPKPGTPELSRVDYGPILYYNIAQGCAGAYRRRLIDAFCAVHDFGILPHDWALNLMAHQEQGFYFLNRELLLYRIHGHNVIGIDDNKHSASERIPRLEKYAAELDGALSLPLPEPSINEIQAILVFTRTRIDWLQDKRMIHWFKGFFQHFRVLKQYFFWQYLKDFVLVILGKIPKNK